MGGGDGEQMGGGERMDMRGWCGGSVGALGGRDLRL